VTITLDDDTARWVRIEAARHDTSVSRWVGQMLEQRRGASTEYERARRAYLERTPMMLKAPGAAYPARDALHDR
jgi:plasmid stability protein